MKLQKLRITMIVMLFGLILLCSQYVYAEDFEMQISANQTQVKPGDTIEVQIQANNMKRKKSWCKCIFRKNRI